MQKAARDAQAIRQETTPERLQARGDAAASIGDLTRAEQYYAAAMSAGGSERALARRLMVVCTRDGRYPAAADYGQEYLRKHPSDTPMRFAVATVDLGLGKLDRSRVELEQVVAERPEWADAHYALATVLRQTGEGLAEADRQLREYLRLSPDGQYAESARASLLKSVP